MRVLVVDDFRPFREFIRSLLLGEVEPTDIAEAEDGRTAVSLAEQLQPDFIFLDIGLPEVNGIDAAKQIRRVSPESIIVVVSEIRQAEVRAKALEAGAEEYVVKADAGQELPSIIRAALRASQVTEENMYFTEEHINPDILSGND